jgi:hypothetical protein
MFASRAVAETAVVESTAQTIRIEGYHAAGDGGGAYYVRVDRKPRHGGHLLTADGSWWEITGHDFSARQFGAHGNGTHDDSASLQAALDCPLVGSLLLPPGRYRAAGLRLRRNCAIIGQAAELVWEEPGYEGDILSISAPDVSVRSLTFRGTRYADASSPVGPYTLLRIDPAAPQDAGEVRIQDVSFIGGIIGCVVGLVSNVFIDRVRFERCRTYGLVLLRGPRKIVIDGLIAQEIGAYGAVKTSLEGTARATERLVLSGFVVTDCGRIEPRPDLWQEGLDLVAGFAREIVVSNGVISNCGNGGIELKTAGGVFLDEDDEYQDILITGVVISCTGNVHGIVLNWHGGKTNRQKRGRRIMIANNIIRHQQATTLAASGIHLSAWSDLHVVDNFIDGAQQGIVLAPVGSSDDTAANVRIAGNRIVGVQNGVSARSGHVQALDISGNTIECARTGVSLNGASCVGLTIGHNRIRQAGSSEHILACINLCNARDVEIWNNKLDSDHGWGVFVHDDEHGPTSGLVLKNIVCTARESFHIRGGDWQLFDNFVRAEPTRHTWIAGKQARIAAAWNVRGLRSAPPKDQGSAGDVALHAKRRLVLSTAPLGWWADMSQPDSRGVWTAINAAPEIQKPLAEADPLEPTGWAARLRGSIQRLKRAMKRRWR